MTRLFGVIGYPISHSLSPAMHTAAFRSLKMDAVYSSFEVPPAFLKPVVAALCLAGVEGLNVTVPLKERVLSLAGRLDPAARAIGAANTLVIRNRKITGYNTDAYGFLMGLKELGWRGRPSRVVVLGAGGAARAVVWALAHFSGMQITLANRNVARAKQLAKRARQWGKKPVISATTLSRVSLGDADWLINATSVGLHANDKLPLKLGSLNKRTRVYDLVYHRETALIKAARRRGCVASGGLSMLLYQGAESFRLWTRRSPDLSAMRKALMAEMRRQF